MNNPQVSLTAEYVGVTEADIQLKVKNMEENTQSRFYRNDLLLNSGTFVQTETVFTDTSLLPAYDYIYKAQLIRDGKPAGFSQPLQITTMDTTSHEFSREIFSFGQKGSSMFYDVQIINRNNN